MWLLNTSSFKLEEFYSDVPSYAILSHRWKKDEELSFGGLEEPHPHSNRTGYNKVKTFCVEARKRRLAYVWADTCCIDKKSSAELSEAINSMYAYYNRATICYVYLGDVVSLKDFEQSSWFTRGWTLQELLAPSKLHFFNSKWKPLGSRRGIAPKIERITGIPKEIFAEFQPCRILCCGKAILVSQKKNDKRRRLCLLSSWLVPNQHASPLWRRCESFSEASGGIMKISTDVSIFLWEGPAVDAFRMLALKPSYFLDIPDNIESMARHYKNLFSMSQGWSLNNAGISRAADISPYLLTDEFECIFALHLLGLHIHPRLAIFIKKQ